MKSSRTQLIAGLLTLGMSLAANDPARAGFLVLHSFNGAVSDATGPVYGKLLLSGSQLYGMTNWGGSADQGAIFKIGADGSGYAVIHSFAGGSEGGRPTGSLTQSGSTLYGMAGNAGAGGANDGTIFQIGPDGTGYSVLHTFGGGSGDGASPQDSMTLSPSTPTFYGLTFSGGSANRGTIFQIGTDGSGFGLLHSFLGGSTDGQQPNDSLVQSGSTLYGTCNYGGSSGDGTIFSIHADGTGYTTLHNFTDADGFYPEASLVLSGSTLYGTTEFSSKSTYTGGTVFKMNTDGTGFSLLHTFTAHGDGSLPTGSLILSGSHLFGTTDSGGSASDGTIFELGTDGTNYNVLHSFSGTDGEFPQGALTLSGSTLYGMAFEGGSFGGGAIFSLTVAVPEPSTLVLAVSGLASSLIYAWRRRIVRP